MTTATAIALVSLILGGGAGVTLVGYLIAHAKKHQHVDDRLDAGSQGFERNTMEHGILNRKLEDVQSDLSRTNKTLAIVATDVKWLRRRNGGEEIENDSAG